MSTEIQKQSRGKSTRQRQPNCCLPCFGNQKSPTKNQSKIDSPTQNHDDEKKQRKQRQRQQRQRQQLYNTQHQKSQQQRQAYLLGLKKQNIQNDTFSDSPNKHTHTTYNQNGNGNAQLNESNDPETLDSLARSGFITKVYTLLTIQLFLTMCIGYFAFNSPEFKTFFLNPIVLIALTIVLLVLVIIIFCAKQFFRKYALPIFILFTITFALVVGVAITRYESKIVLLATGITFLLVAALTIFAYVTKSDFTSYGPYLMVICIVVFVFGVVCIFWKDPIAKLVYSCLSALLFSLYLIYDTQLVLGRGENKFTLDDAYLASIQLYIDIIQIFLNLLKILNFKGD